MTVRTLDGPGVDPGEVVRFINEAQNREHTITLFAECEVEYEGRAASDLGAGERVILLKPDGTVAVHKAEKRKPVNWQPPGSSYSAEVRGDAAWIEAYRRNPEEVVVIALKRVYSATSKRLEDHSELELTGTEADVVDKIVDEPALIESGFRVLDTEWPTGAGPVDVYGKDEDGVPVCVEVKRGTISPANVMQLRRYIDSVEDGDPSEFRGIVVGGGLSERAENVLDREGFGYREIEPDINRSSRTRTLDEFSG